MSSITIDLEAKQRIRIPFDVDFFCNRYQTENEKFVFSSPSIETLEKNLFYLLKNSYHVDLESKFVRKPWLLSYEQYGTVTLDYLIMYINDVSCVEDFNIPSVILPTMSAIIKICQDKVTKTSKPNLLEKIEW